MVLITGLFFFVIVYQRKMIKNQVALRRLEDERQQELLKAVIEAQETERKRLAEDLHDSVGQVLSAIKLKLHKLDKLNEGQNAMLADTRKLTDECIQEIRNIIHNVLPPVLTDFGLIDALQALCVKMNDNTPIQVAFTRKLGDERFGSEIELTLYRIAQELFGNAVKHSEASTIHVDLAKNGNTLVMSFRDNGKGFNIETVKHGFGIKNLRSRVQLINGKIDIYSKPLSGTITTINIPLPRR
ncbi:sensor histidine kinase [Mucilaginibacter ginsenosidivorans]|uniref:histidine kinase n=2 Tax=Mucilaginibacter ginsenosidivorans TaxID=398053 RepID=A0A5B8URP8_9SPHI|nr:sensor histidine kinase [Mucilaginibacter ginsenosidivorans]QEC61528.1 sensor histidine kinase [Mucilaginibacter ginsenosidivorans]